MNLKTGQRRFTGDIVSILEPFSIVTIFFVYEENISISNKYSALDSKIIKDFNDMMASQTLHRFEHRSLHTAHPLSVGSLLDPHSKVLHYANSRKRTPKL